MKTPALESLFYQSCKFEDFIKKRLQHRRFPVNVAKFSRAPLLKNICKRLLLRLYIIFNRLKANVTHI